MSTASVASVATPKPGAGRGLLPASVLIWAATMIVGQWVFFYYLAGFYVRAIVAGDIQDWSRNRGIFKGYAPGDFAWNAYFGAHVTLAAVIAFGGVLQMLPQIRDRAPWLHRWNGRAFMLAAAGGAVTGLWMTLARGIGVSGSNKLGVIAISLNAVLVLAFAAVAWRFARRREIAAHRRWALRLFMVANGVWWLRILLYGWYPLTRGAGVTDNLDGPMNIVFDFASYLAPLAMLEFYLRARDGAGEAARTVAAAAIFFSTGYMWVGILAHSMVHVPLVRLF
jgi:hypothetical protein